MELLTFPLMLSVPATATRMKQNRRRASTSDVDVSSSVRVHPIAALCLATFTCPFAAACAALKLHMTIN
jgi:hypothetical protein